MTIKINQLRVAIKSLEDLPHAEVVKQHSDPASLSMTIQSATHPARSIIHELIGIIEERASLQMLLKEE